MTGMAVVLVLTPTAAGVAVEDPTPAPTPDLAKPKTHIKDEDQADMSRVATEHVKCDVCHTLVDIVYTKAMDLEPRFRTELKVLEIVGWMCGETAKEGKPTMAPAIAELARTHWASFTREYEIAWDLDAIGRHGGKLHDGMETPTKWKFVDKPPLDLPKHLPQPMFVPDWRTTTMQKACDLANSGLAMKFPIIPSSHPFIQVSALACPRSKRSEKRGCVKRRRKSAAGPIKSERRMSRRPKPSAITQPTRTR